ncbi:MAG: hypothetical protein ACM3XM_10390 [Mycobacterium leprae]
MTSVFLITFFVGFGLTVISALMGALHVGGHADVGHGGHMDLGHGAHADVGHGAHVHADAGQGDQAAVSPINFQSLMAFLMGFGGIGYLVTVLGVTLFLVVLLLAIVGGVAASWLIYRFLRLLASGERPMADRSYVGIVGTLNASIRAGGTGEMVYTQNDTRQSLAARSVDGATIAQGEEVVVVRYEKGIAYVQLWHEFMAER